MPISLYHAHESDLRFVLVARAVLQRVPIAALGKLGGSGSGSETMLKSGDGLDNVSPVQSF